MNFILIAVTTLLSCGIISGMVKTTSQRSELEEAMQMACQSSQTQTIQILLEAGVDKNMLTEDGATLLYRAAENDQYEVVELLMAAQADRTITYQGLTPLLIATRNGHTRIVQLLMDLSFTNVPLSNRVKSSLEQLDGCKEVYSASSSVIADRPSRISASLQPGRMEAPRSSAAAEVYARGSHRPELSGGIDSHRKSSGHKHRSHGKGDRKEKKSTADANFTKGNDNFAAHKWQLALDYYKRALKEVELESENHYLILGNMMQICHGDAHGVKAKPDKVVKYARILEAQSVQSSMQALSLLTLAECFYKGQGVSKNIALALEYAQKASQQSANRLVQEQGCLLIKTIAEELGSEAREKEKKDREHISKITEEKRRLEENAARSAAALLQANKEREEEARKYSEALLHANRERAELQARLEQQASASQAAATKFVRPARSLANR